MGYFGNRQNPLGMEDQEQLETAFESLCEHLGQRWLESKGSHPLQQLWLRKDALATSELYSLGYSMRKFEQADKHWLKHQVRQIKSNQENNRKGALFEVMGLGWLNGNIVPAKRNQAGYDGTIHFSSGALARLSLKNYGISAHQKEFFKKSSRAESILCDAMKKSDKNAIQLFVDAPKGYPSDQHWDLLYEGIPTVIAVFNEGAQNYAFKDAWFVGLNKLDLADKQLHKGHQSYTCLLMSPFHKNEEQNLLSKLDEACGDFSAHSLTESDGAVNLIYVHLPVTASLSNCFRWANEYFENHPEKPISGVILYQPSVATDVDSNETFINHCCVICSNKRFADWANLHPSNRISMTVPIGRTSQSPTESKMVMGTEMVSIDNRYIFQAGHHYILPSSQDGKINGVISRLGSGIFTHLVLKIFPNEPEFVISGHFAPEDTLLIL